MGNIFINACICLMAGLISDQLRDENSLCISLQISFFKWNLDYLKLSDATFYIIILSHEMREVYRVVRDILE